LNLFILKIVCKENSVKIRFRYFPSYSDTDGYEIAAATTVKRKEISSFYHRLLSKDDRLSQLAVDQHTP
jgi:hypothetical protein